VEYIVGKYRFENSRVMQLDERMKWEKGTEH
jgi:hypothetical protein